jgi:hypothetical protein
MEPETDRPITIVRKVIFFVFFQAMSYFPDFIPDCIKDFIHHIYCRLCPYQHKYIHCEHCNSKFILHQNGYECDRCNRKICESCSDKGDVTINSWNTAFICEEC